jgi:hypothetical protein
LTQRFWEEAMRLQKRLYAYTLSFALLSSTGALAQQMKAEVLH